MANDCVEHRKARLVAKGFHQQYGLDYSETFSPVLRPAIVHFVLSLAVRAGWSMRQLDMQSAFLHGDLTVAVFMVQPPGFIHPNYPNHVCKLRKAIYGLKQAPRAWFSKLSSKLLELDFVASHANSSLFTYICASLRIYFLVYVDDIVITGSNPSAIISLIATLRLSFPMKDLGQLHYFLGVEVHHSNSGILLSQHKYIEDLLKKTNMHSSKPLSILMATTGSLTALDGALFEYPTLYRSVVGSLQYLSFTRSDLAFAVNRVYQYKQTPRVPHW